MSPPDRRSLTDLPRLLRDARFFRELSLRDAATEIGISASTLNRMEADENPHVPDSDSLYRVVTWLKLEIVLLPRSASAAALPPAAPHG